MGVSGRSYGKDLPDQVDRIATLTDNQLEFVADIRDLYRERAALERDYANKLQLLVKKSAEKTKKRIPTLVVGADPTKAWGQDTIKQSTLENAYTECITSMGDVAQEHINLADSLNSQVVEVLKVTERTYEERKKKQVQYFQKLLSERDRAYSARLKSKQKYDEDCVELDSYSVKQERSSEDRHAERAARQIQQQKSNMLTSKNNYIIALAIANGAKAKFYDVDLPILEDQLQTLQTQLIKKLTQVMLEAHALQERHYDTMKNRVAAAESVVAAINPAVDQDIFIDHNDRPFNVSKDWAFEPCATHYDTGDMSLEDGAKVYLQNRLSKCRSKLEELKPVLIAKDKDVQRLVDLVTAYSTDRGLGDAESVADDYLEAQHQLAFYATSETVLKTEVETISAALGGDEGQQHPHTFKSSSFSIPTTCAHCKSSIWGLSKQGKTCKACGVSVHTKCELKVPADCSGSSGVARTHTASEPASSNINSSNFSLSSSTSSNLTTAAAITPTPSSFAHSVSEVDEELPSARVIFDFSPTSPFELAVSEGALVHIVEEDDGSGWAKVVDSDGSKGLVPSSYLQSVESSAPSSLSASTITDGPSDLERQKVRVLYDYQAQGPGEMDVKTGEIIELTQGLTGGQNYADGWSEGINSLGVRGIFPSNYVEAVQ